jgi:hypothetical protein
MRWSRAEICDWIAAGCPDAQTWQAIKSANAKRANGSTRAGKG